VNQVCFMAAIFIFTWLQKRHSHKPPPPSAGKMPQSGDQLCWTDSGRRMDSEAPETLPVVRCPGCEEPMQPKGVAPVTRELDDISYVCPKCGAETKRTMKRA